MIKSFRYPVFYSFPVLSFVCICMLFGFSFKTTGGLNKAGKLKINFINTANGKPVVLKDSTYTNPFGENYSISKLKYYIGLVNVPGAESVDEKEPYHLIDASKDDQSFQLLLKPGTYNSIEFLVGVDSASNCSGAQSGALDAANDMFWTWNSGYVMFKLEGTSSSSTADLQRIEHHVGGYKGANNVAKKIRFLLPENLLLRIKENSVTELVIETNMDHYWKAQSEIKISELPLTMEPGPLSKKIASNFPDLFSVKSVK